MFYFQLTPNIISAAKLASSLSHPSVAESFSPYTQLSNRHSGIPLLALQQLSQLLLQEFPNSNDYYLHALLKGSRLILHSPPKRQKSPELLKILKEIQDQLDEKEYKRMTFYKEPQESLKSQFYVSQISLLINVLLSMIAVFVACFYISHQISTNTSFQVLSSLFAALIVGIAEGYFFTRDLIHHD